MRAESPPNAPADAQSHSLTLTIHDNSGGVRLYVALWQETGATRHLLIHFRTHPRQICGAPLTNMPPAELTR